MTEVVTQRAPVARPAAALAGIRVVEIGFAAAGPLVGKYLANHGAEVIKIESTKAPDVFRSTYPPFKDNVPGPDRAGMFAFYNDGKRSVTLNLRHPKGVELARALVRASDVLIESFPAGTMARRGLSYAALAKDHPELVMLSSCNQGQTGPHAQHPGYGSQLTALAGFVHLLGEADRSPVILYGPYIDYIAVGYGVIAVLAALVRRNATGQGAYIDLSQYEAGLQFMGPALLEHAVNGTIPTRAGNADTVAAPHGVYPCAGSTTIEGKWVERGSCLAGPSGSVRAERLAASERSEPTAIEIEQERWVALSVWSDDEWRRLRDALGDPAWSREERWETAQGRRASAAELDARIGEWTRTRSRGDVVDALRARGLCVAPVLSVSELFTDPQLAHRGFFRALPHPVLEAVQCLSAPFTLSGTPSVQERAGPLLGQDSDRVFGEILGLSADERASLARDGVFD